MLEECWEISVVGSLRSELESHNNSNSIILKNSPNMPSAEMNKRMTAVLYTKGNEVCADCPARRPLWASLLVNPVEDDRKIGVLCCAECAQHHHFELGEKRTMIKYLKMVHECTSHL